MTDTPASDAQSDPTELAPTAPGEPDGNDYPGDGAGDPVTDGPSGPDDGNL